MNVHYRNPCSNLFTCRIREDGDGEVYVEGLEEKMVSSQDDIYK